MWHFFKTIDIFKQKPQIYINGEDSVGSHFSIVMSIFFIIFMIFYVSETMTTLFERKKHKITNTEEEDEN